MALSQHSAAVLGSCCMDKASGNAAYVAQARALVNDLPERCLLEEEWCGLHCCNNMKIGSKDLCKLTAKYYSLSALMKAGSYVSGALHRLIAYVDDKLVRLIGVKPDSDVVAKNKRIVSALFDTEAPYHYSKAPDGTVRSSNLIHELADMCALDTGSWHDDVLICHC